MIPGWAGITILRSDNTEHRGGNTVVTFMNISTPMWLISIIRYFSILLAHSFVDYWNLQRSLDTTFDSGSFYF
jgi:hypothetical protein